MAAISAQADCSPWHEEGAKAAALRRRRLGREQARGGACEAFRRRVFALVAADEMGLTAGATVVRVPMRAGDVCFFYTHWLHRAPAPPASVDEEARVCLFGVFGKAGASEGRPVFRHHVLGE